jgi:hypothetical protein
MYVLFTDINGLQILAGSRLVTAPAWGKQSKMGGRSLGMTRNPAPSSFMCFGYTKQQHDGWWLHTDVAWNRGYRIPVHGVMIGFSLQFTAKPWSYHQEMAGFSHMGQVLS